MTSASSSPGFSQLVGDAPEAKSWPSSCAPAWSGWHSPASVRRLLERLKLHPVGQARSKQPLGVLPEVGRELVKSQLVGDAPEAKSWPSSCAPAWSGWHSPASVRRLLERLKLHPVGQARSKQPLGVLPEVGRELVKA